MRGAGAAGGEGDESGIVSKSNRYANNHVFTVPYWPSRRQRDTAVVPPIGMQNFSEGTAVSVPLRREGMSRGKAFWYDVRYKNCFHLCRCERDVHGCVREAKQIRFFVHSTKASVKAF